MIALSSEFPNDNPALHRGVSWVCLEVTGPPVPIPAPAEPEPFEVLAPIQMVAPAPPVSVAVAEAVAAPRPSGIIPIASDRHDDEDEPIVVEELEPLGEVAVVEAATTLPPPPDDPFMLLCSTLSDVAIGAGAPNVAAALPGLLFEARLDPALGPDALAALAEGGLAADGSVTAAFTMTTNAWRAVLGGTSDDLSACGGATLDEWASDLLARMLGSAARAPLLRRELRSRGVAAFGLLAA